MLIEWTKHIRDQEKKSKFEETIKGSVEGFRRLYDILIDREDSIDRSEINMSTYDTPNWEARQAHKNGRREEIAALKTLIKSTWSN